MRHLQITLMMKPLTQPPLALMEVDYILILEKILNESLKNMNVFISKENDMNTILYNVLKNIFIKYIPKENFNLE